MPWAQSIGIVSFGSTQAASAFQLRADKAIKSTGPKAAHYPIHCVAVPLPSRCAVKGARSAAPLRGFTLDGAASATAIIAAAVQAHV